ncbi:hypothetical protein JTE90_026865 [Oedothorax gibbosus]|uniref:Uncharacterized protein n=1 Tax=Oedothorax gibbosus TaxID=931172 RepID=A0AAV6U1S6_9ARAC|nr:hypothetical protein JTE90_026865 [Oedothorax gibbosus]
MLNNAITREGYPSPIHVHEQTPHDTTRETHITPRQYPTQFPAFSLSASPKGFTLTFECPVSGFTWANRDFIGNQLSSDNVI